MDIARESPPQNMWLCMRPKWDTPPILWRGNIIRLLQPPKPCGTFFLVLCVKFRRAFSITTSFSTLLIFALSPWRNIGFSSFPVGVSNTRHCCDKGHASDESPPAEAFVHWRVCCLPKTDNDYSNLDEIASRVSETSHWRQRQTWNKKNQEPLDKYRTEGGVCGD